MAVSLLLFRRFGQCFGSRHLYRKLSTLSLDEIIQQIKNKQLNKIVFMAGAGISTPSGIPDFRTPGSGLYDQLEKYKLPYAEAIFDLLYLKMDPRPFFSLAKELYPGNYRPNLSHYFVRLIQDKEQLLRMYTQNIDGLERLAGINLDLLIEAHGNFSVSTCMKCRKVYNTDAIKEEILKGNIPKCDKCKGIIKPDIVFFGEQLPQSFWTFLDDMPECDLLIIMGTSLEVEPFAGIAEMVDKKRPRLLINKNVVGNFIDSERVNDVVLVGDLIENLSMVVRKLGWDEEMKSLISKNEKELDKKYSTK